MPGTKPPVDMTPVISSSIGAIGYAPDTSSLYVRFRNGALYLIRSVPRSIYQDFLASRSKGRFYDQKIRSVFTDVSCLNGRTR